MTRWFELSAVLLGLFGILPNLFKGGPTKILTNVVLPGLPLFKESIKAVTPLVKTGIQTVKSVVPQQPPPGPKGAPYQYGPGGQPLTGFPYPVQYLGSYGGGGSWDYSTSWGTSSDLGMTTPFFNQGFPYFPGEDWGEEWRQG